MPFTVRLQREGSIWLEDQQTGTKAEIYLFGALLNAFEVVNRGNTFNLVDGFSSKADARANITGSFKSAKLSPFVCRMRNGRYELNGKTYQTKKFFLGEHAIHGLVYDLPFTVSVIRENETAATVVLTAEYNCADKGYPFPYQLSIEWTLQAGNSLAVTTTVTNRHSEPIPYADGWHPYFTLGGTVDEWKLQFNSRRRYGFDADLLADGSFETDTRFETGTSLQGIVLDHSFELDGPARCILSNNAYQLTITTGTEYPVLQLYTPDSRKTIAIENLSGPPDNFNNGMHLLMLEPDETKSFKVNYSVEVL